MGQVPSFPQSSVRSPPLARPHSSSPAASFLAPQVSFITAMYLNVANAWTLFYLGQSFHFFAPWRQCPLLNASSFGEKEAKEKGDTERWEGIWKRRKGVSEEG